VTVADIVTDIVGVVVFVAVFGPILWLERRTQHRMAETIESHRPDND
jgi:hypothetical protein